MACATCSPRLADKASENILLAFVYRLTAISLQEQSPEPSGDDNNLYKRKPSSAPCLFGYLAAYRRQQSPGKLEIRQVFLQGRC